jgi:hypothetical protein
MMGISNLVPEMTRSSSARRPHDQMQTRFRFRPSLVNGMEFCRLHERQVLADRELDTAAISRSSRW